MPDGRTERRTYVRTDKSNCNSLALRTGIRIRDEHLASIPLKSIPMSRHLPEMLAECQTVQMCLPLTPLALRWHCADFNCLFSWPWWRHRECSDPRDTKSESKIPSTLLTALLRCWLLRTLSTLTCWSTMEVLPFHVRRAMPRSVNACISSLIILPIIVSVWMIFNYHRYDFYQWIMRLWVNIARQMLRHLNMATFVEIDVSGRVKASDWH